jgi:hypothetical protein
MNAVHVCKLRNGVKKTPQFLLFSLAKGGTKTTAHLSIADLIPVRNEYTTHYTAI